MQKKRHQDIERLGNLLVDSFHNLALFIIGGTIFWSASVDYINLITDKGYAELKDILLLFIYLELGAMVGIYFKTHRLPVQYLIYIAITALARHLVIDVQKVAIDNMIWVILSTCGAILILSIAVLVLKFSAKKYSRFQDID